MAAAGAATLIPVTAKALRTATEPIFDITREVLFTDLANVRFSASRMGGTKKHPIPQTVTSELHLNPVSLGIMVLGAGLAMWLLGLRMEKDQQVADQIASARAKLLQDQQALANAYVVRGIILGGDSPTKDEELASNAKGIAQVQAFVQADKIALNTFGLPYKLGQRQQFTLPGVSLF